MTSGQPMRLAVYEYPVSEVVIGSRTALDGGRLTVCADDLSAVADAEPAIAGMDLAVVRPGESARIVHALDAVEAMAKAEGPGTVYPGFCGPVVPAGRGITHKLTGFLVVSAGQFPHEMEGGLAYREAIIDMSGPGQPYCQASRSIDLVLTYQPASQADNWQFDAAVRRCTLRIAQTLGSATMGRQPSERRIYELGPVAPDLPRVVYVDQIMSQTLMTRTFLYGEELGDTLPTLLHPNELLDGAIVSGNYKNLQKVATYLHCNKPLMRELYRRHGVDLNFAGIVINRGHRVTQLLKERGAQMAAKLALQLGSEGAVVAFEGGGSATIDFMFTIRALEDLGIRAVGEMFEHGQAGSGEAPIVFHVPEADALVSRGATEEVFVAPKVDRVIGGIPHLRLYAGQVIEDARESFEVTSNDYWGLDWQLGESGFVAREY